MRWRQLQQEGAARASWWAAARQAWRSIFGPDGAPAQRRRRSTTRLVLAGGLLLLLVFGLEAYRSEATAVPRPVAGWAPPVGVLATATDGGRGMGAHFCTASVVDSPAGDLVVTAAHCVTGRSASRIVFVPGYHGRQAPYGVWAVTRVLVDRNWSQSADPDDDVAFLLVHKAGTTASVQSVTGGDQLGIGQRPGQTVRVIGYPDSTDNPISCVNKASLFSPTQLQFDCDDYTGGTSGSPLIAKISPSTGLGTVIGVIGGFEQGGYTASVSYAARLEANVAALYKIATAQS
jgi:V8-like Glu-specific endopeptidase